MIVSTGILGQYQRFTDKSGDPFSHELFTQVNRFNRSLEGISSFESFGEGYELSTRIVHPITSVTSCSLEPFGGRTLTH